MVGDLNIRNKMILKLIEANDFQPVSLTREEVYKDIEHIEITTTLNDEDNSMTFTFRKIERG